MSLFKKKYIPPSEYSIQSKSGSCAFIRDEFIHDKKKLEELRLLVCPSVPRKQAALKVLITSAKSILDTTEKRAEKLYNEALTTSDVNKFFKNMTVVKQDIDRMEEIEAYVYYADSFFTIHQFKERLQIEIRHLIDRSCKTANENSDPEKACEKVYQEFISFKDMMDGKSIQKLQQKFKKM